MSHLDESDYAMATLPRHPRHRLNKSRKGDYWILVGPYDADLVEWLKSTIPAGDRQWDGPLKAWRIQGEDSANAVRDRIGDHRES